MFPVSENSLPTNPILRGIIRKLRRVSRESGSAIWDDLADRLSHSNRTRAEVNISRLNRYTDDGDTVIVPGKVLGSGRLDHSLSVAAFNFSARSQERIQNAGGKTLSIEDLLDENPEGKGVTIME